MHPETANDADLVFVADRHWCLPDNTVGRGTCLPAAAVGPYDRAARNAFSRLPNG